MNEEEMWILHELRRHLDEGCMSSCYGWRTCEKMNKFHDMFNSTMNDYHRNLYKVGLESAIKMRLHPPKFKKGFDEGTYVSVPLRDFYGDCSSCQYFEYNPGGLSNGHGECKIHDYKHGCGWGMTCKDHLFNDITLYEIDLFEKQLKKKDGEPL